MITIEDIILQLIQDHKKVVLPKIGTLIVEKTSASIHPVSHEITPPHSTLIFTNSIEGTSEEMERRFAKSANITPEEAKEKINQYFDTLRNTLNNTGAFSIEGICSIKKDYQDCYLTTVIQGTIIDKNDLGLKTIKTELAKPKPTIVETQKTTEPKKEINDMKSQNTPNEDTPKQPVTENQPALKKSKKGVWIIIFVLIIALLGVVGYLFKDNLSSTTGPKQAEVAKDTATVATEVPAEAPADTAVAKATTEEPVKEAEPAVAVSEPVATPATAPTTTKATSKEEKADLSVITYAPKNGGKFYVIAMSFKDLGNASKGVKQLRSKGYNPVVIEKNEQGLIRVAYKPGYDTERLARDFADELYEKKNLNPWIVKY